MSFRVWVVEIYWDYEGSEILGLFKEEPSEELITKRRTVECPNYSFLRGNNYRIYQMEVE